MDERFQVSKLIDVEAMSEELERLQEVPVQVQEEGVAIIETALEKLVTEQISIPDFLVASQILFPMESWKEYYFLESELTEGALQSGLTFEPMFKKLKVFRSKLPPIEPFIIFICEKYQMHTSMSTTRYDWVRPSLAQTAQDNDWVFPDMYVPLDRNRREMISRGVKVAFIDSGVDYQHPDLSHIPPEQCFDFSGTRTALDEDGHGTHCIGILNSKGVVDERCTGIAPGASVYSLKALTKDGGTLESILMAFDFGIEEEIQIYNFSFGARVVKLDSPFALLTAVIDQAINEYDLIICAAAGNEGAGAGNRPKLNSITSPGDCPSALTVGAVDSFGYLAPFSSRGSAMKNTWNYRKPNLCAPGVHVVSCLPSTTKDSQELGLNYQCLSGTSMATPMVTGLCCLLRGVGMDRVEIFKTLSAACHVPIDHNGRPYSQDYEVGWGVPDIEEIVRQLGYAVDQPLRAAKINRQQGSRFMAAQAALPLLHCDWSSVPLPSDAQEDSDFYRCEDDPSKVIFAAAYSKYKSQASGLKVSREKLKKLYGEQCLNDRNQARTESVDRMVAVQVFKANGRQCGLESELVVKQGNLILSSIFFMEDQGAVTYTLPQCAYFKEEREKLLRGTLRKGSRLYALIFDEASLAQLPEADEYILAFWKPTMMAQAVSKPNLVYWCSLGRRESGTNVCWVVENPDSLGSDALSGMLRQLFWLEPKEQRVKRCLDLLQSERESQYRLSMPRAFVLMLIDEFGIDFLLQTPFPGFKVLKEGDEIIIRTR